MRCLLSASSFTIPHRTAIQGREVKLQKSTVKSAIPPSHAHVLAHPSHPKAATGHPEPRAHPLREAALDATFDQLAAEAARIEKLGGKQPVRYPHGLDTDLSADYQNMQPPSTTMHSPHGGGSYQTSVTPVVQLPARHEFQDRVDEIRQRTGARSAAAAMTQARLTRIGRAAAARKRSKRHEATAQASSTSKSR